MATVSRQSAFWGVVALGLNTFVQDGGKVLGFPAEWSRALRLSPVICIFDTLGVLFSNAFFYHKTGSVKRGFMLAARYRCLTEDDPGKPRLERTWWFRFSVFALGAMPQAVKILGMSGIHITKIWGMAYLVSFPVVEGLDLLQPRQHGNDHVLEQHTAVLDDFMNSLGGMAVFTQVTCLMIEVFLIPSIFKCDVEPSSFSPLPRFGRGTVILARLVHWCSLVMLSVLFTDCLCVSILFSHNSEWNLAHLFKMFIAIFQPLMAVGLLYYSMWDQEPLDGRKRWSCPLGPVLIQSAAIYFLFAVLSILEMASEGPRPIRLFPGPSLLKPLKQKVRRISLLFAILSIAVIFCYYVGIYDPSNTYKPPWTEYFG